MSQITKLNLSKSITNMALVHSANAFGKMIKEEVILHKFEHNPESWELKNVEDGLFALRTDIKGDFSGEVYLIVLPEDEPKVADLLLPASMVGQPEMREAILLEVDNILTASIITKYSEILKREVIGDVPEAQRYSNEELEKFLSEKSEMLNYPFTYSCQLITLRSDIRLYIAGFFDQQFIDDVEVASEPSYHKERAAQAKGEEQTYISKTPKGLFRKILPW